MALARDENPYIAEWVRHHLDLGFNQILLFDNCSKVPLQSEIDKLSSSYADRVYVEIEPPSDNPQWCAYQRAYQHQLAAEAEWVAYIDIDEFLMLDRPLREVLDRPPKVGTIFVFWQYYDANGQIEYEDRPVVERFTRPCGHSAWYGKSIVRSEAVLCPGSHLPVLHAGYHMIDVNGRYLRKAPTKPAVAGVRLNHYYTKSYEEWLQKIERGSSDNRCLKKYVEFFWYNPDLIELYDPTLAFLQQNTAHRPATVNGRVSVSELPGKRLNLGCAENALPGWINSDLYPMGNSAMQLDFTKPLAYPDACFDAVFCEHAIEHVSKQQAAGMLAEAKRVLRPGGHIRLVTPSLDNLCRLVLEPASPDALTYLAAVRRYLKKPDMTLTDAVNELFYEHGHKHIYAVSELCGMVDDAGFRDVRVMPPKTYGNSIFNGVDGHHKIVGNDIAIIEAVALEAMA